jgi:bacterioferritin
LILSGNNENSPFQANSPAVTDALIPPEHIIVGQLLMRLNLRTFAQQFGHSRIVSGVAEYSNSKENNTMTVELLTPTEDLRKNGASSKSPLASIDRQTLIDGLNRDLAGEYQAILMYTHYSAKLTGAFRRELRAFFQEEIVDEQCHAQFLADKIASLGGEPTTEPRPVLSADHPRDMLVNALAAEDRAIAEYKLRIRQAGVFGDVGLKVVLENQIADETRHKEELERIVSGWEE